MVLYEEVKSLFEKYNCQFNISKSDFGTNRNTSEKYKYIASCGHENSIVLSTFKHRGTGILCPQCVHKRLSIKSKISNKECLHIHIEDKATDILIDKIKDTFNCKKQMKVA